MEFKLIEALDELSAFYKDDLNMVKDLIFECNKHFNNEQIEMIIKAYKCANDLHRGQKRKSGEPYIIHPVRVAHILLTEIHLIDSDAICAALLHDTIEDTGITEEALAEMFNKDIAYLVAGVSKIKDLDFTSKSEEEQYNDCILLRSCAKDIRVIMIKIADRTHNMRTLIYKGDKSLIEKYENSTSPIEELKIDSNAKQNAKSIETITLFVPLAKRIGANLIANELEDISNMYLKNSLFREIRGNIKNFERDNAEKIEEILETLEDSLLSANISHDIRAKTKTYSEVSKYLKRKKTNSISEVPGLLSFEINVNKKEECYQVLSVLSGVYKDYKVNVVDFINYPKANGYKAIHLEVQDLMGYTIVFKICTHKMKLINDHGIAALTELYPNKNIKSIQDSLNETNPFVMSLQSIGDLYKDNNSYFKHIKREILSKQITIKTKNGDEFTFPNGATVLDLAFRLHTEVGAKAIGAIVNGVNVSNNYVLQDGDNVNVITDENQVFQSKESMDFAMTSYAKREMRRALRRNKK